eukprot:106888_1
MAAPWLQTLVSLTYLIYSFCPCGRPNNRRYAPSCDQVGFGGGTPRSANSHVLINYVMYDTNYEPFKQQQLNLKQNNDCDGTKVTKESLHSIENRNKKNNSTNQSNYFTKISWDPGGDTTIVEYGLYYQRKENPTNHYFPESHTESNSMSTKHTQITALNIIEPRTMHHSDSIRLEITQYHRDFIRLKITQHPHRDSVRPDDSQQRDSKRLEITQKRHTVRPVFTPTTSTFERPKIAHGQKMNPHPNRNTTTQKRTEISIKIDTKYSIKIESHAMTKSVNIYVQITKQNPHRIQRHKEHDSILCINDFNAAIICYFVWGVYVKSKDNAWIFYTPNYFSIVKQSENMIVREIKRVIEGL